MKPESTDQWAIRVFNELADTPERQTAWLWANRQKLSHLPFFRLIIKRQLRAKNGQGNV
jgi:hypothetical protein